ncbi:MAG: metal ABC transporter ATP-binding protein [Elusimicrobiota bacterium]|jgi:zinc transport system ATP-binding protein|nr:metal ABC transporter ATP-binding protein [Elusimicrobiota bacterium]
MVIIKSQNVSFAYGQNIVLKDVNFELSAADYLCIVGGNGSGKSTLLKGLLNLKKPLEGEIVFSGGLDRADIGYIPQQNVIQKTFPASVYEIVSSGRLNKMGLRPFYNRKDKKIIDKNLQILGIEQLKRKSFSELSGGQQQKVLLARALCSTGKLLILDEPDNSLDPSATESLYEVLKTINGAGIAIIIVSHNVENALSNARKVLHLENKQVFFGDVEDYLKTDIARSFIKGGQND